MYNILIIDDEKMIADGIKYLIKDRYDELNVFCLYDSIEAMTLIENEAIDILLTDISMPEMNGLELQEFTQKMWPQVKTIFLSGYTDFNYVKAAIRQNSCDYILKTEDDQVLINAIDNAIRELKETEKNKELLEISKEYIEREKPLLKQRFFYHIIEKGEPYHEEGLKLLDVSLDMNRDILIIASKMRRVSSEGVFMESVLASKSLVRNQLKENYLVEEYVNSEDEVLWLVQSIDESATYISSLSYLSRSLDIVSKICKEQLNMDIMFVIDSEMSQVKDLSNSIEKLRSVLYRIQIKDGYGVITIDYAMKVLNINKSDDYDLHRKLANDISNIIRYIDDDNAEDAIAQLVDFIGMVKLISLDMLAQEHYTSLKLCILKSINRKNLFDSFAKNPQTYNILVDFMKSDGRVGIPTYTMIIRKIIEYKRDTQVDQYKKVISFLDIYIGEHLNKDLSLTKLSELTHFNPSYLSRIYKQETGISLGDKIQRQKIEKAKELLTTSYEKINCIASEIGINTPAHFTRFFKKHTGMTPNEYRRNTR